MKTYKHLWDDFISDKNIDLAIKKALKNKKKKRRKDVRKALADINSFKKHIKEYACNFENRKHNPKIIYDGISRKQRKIIVPAFDELVIQHMIVQVLQPMFLKGIYEHAYGSVPGRGAHMGAKYIRKWIDKGNCKYCFKADIRHYFDSIPHSDMKWKLSKTIKDERILDILFKIIDVIDVGLPLGFYTSQWLSMWYLKDFDHFVKEHCYALHYMRYMDDIVIMGSNKRKLRKTYEDIVEYLKKEGLQLNNKRQIFRFSYFRNEKEYGRAIDFMGFVFHRNRTALRRSIYYKMCRKARRVSKKGKVTIHEIRQMLSYVGWLSATDTYSAYLEYIKPFFCIQYAKRRLSRYDKRRVTSCG